MYVLLKKGIYVCWYQHNKLLEEYKKKLLTSMKIALMVEGVDGAKDFYFFFYTVPLQFAFLSQYVLPLLKINLKNKLRTEFRNRLMNMGEFSVTAKTTLLIFPVKTYFPLPPYDVVLSSFSLYTLSQAISLPPFFTSTNAY